MLRHCFRVLVSRVVGQICRGETTFHMRRAHTSPARVELTSTWRDNSRRDLLVHGSPRQYAEMALDALMRCRDVRAAVIIVNK